jgi:hypothetical protein
MMVVECRFLILEVKRGISEFQKSAICIQFNPKQQLMAQACRLCRHTK